MKIKELFELLGKTSQKEDIEVYYYNEVDLDSDMSYCINGFYFEKQNKSLFLMGDTKITSHPKNYKEKALIYQLKNLEIRNQYLENKVKGLSSEIDMGFFELILYRLFGRKR